MNIECDRVRIIKNKAVTKDGVSYNYELRDCDRQSFASFNISLYEIYAEMADGNKIGFYRTGGIFTDLEKALRFFDMLCSSLVTPQNLPYVIEDCFSF